MENTTQSSEVKTKNITLGSIVSWMLGILFGLGGIVGIFDKPLTGSLFIIASLIVLPPASKYIQNKLRLTLSKGVKAVIVIILLVIAGTQAQSGVPSEQLAKSEDIQTKSQEKVVPKVEAVKITAAQVVADYKANEVAADAKYKGKTLEISGTIETIGKDIADTPYITFYTSEYAIIDKVQCAFSKSDEVVLAELSKGQKITVQGEVSGKFGNIIVKQCKVVN